jgi:NDP-sugar pyrophosphorylase family protein
MYPIAILAGGLATRLKPVTEKIPKSLVLVSNVPCIDLQLQLLSKSGFTDVVLLVGHLGEMIESHVGDGQRYGVSVTYSYDGAISLGTGGAISRALPLLGENFCVTYGDSYLPMDYKAASRKFRESGKAGLMSIYRNLNPNHRNNVEYSKGEIKKYSKINFSESMHFIDYGFSIFNKSAFDDYLDIGTLDLAVVSENLSTISQLEAFEVNETFYEIGSFEGIQNLNLKLEKEKNELYKATFN